MHIVFFLFYKLVNGQWEKLGSSLYDSISFHILSHLSIGNLIKRGTMWHTLCNLWSKQEKENQSRERKSYRGGDKNDSDLKRFRSSLLRLKKAPRSL